jgi:hypothetical protein
VLFPIGGGVGQTYGEVAHLASLHGLIEVVPGDEVYGNKLIGGVNDRRVSTNEANCFAFVVKTEGQIVSNGSSGSEDGVHDGGRFRVTQT